MARIIIDFTYNDLIIYWDGSHYFKYGIIKRNIYNQIIEINHYIQKKEREGYQVIIIDVGAVEYRLAQGKIDTPYDYLIRGNLGLNGEKRIINEFNQQSNNTLFLLDDNYSNQDVIEVKQMVINNYQKIDKIGRFEVYQQAK